MSDGELEPIEDAVLAELDFVTPQVLTRHEAIHFHMALTHALSQLNLTTEDVGFGTHQYAKTEYIAEAMRNAGDDEEARGRIIDEVGEFVLECSDALASFLLRKGIGGVKFFVWLPCHQGPADYWPRNAAGKPEVRPW